MNSIQFQEIYKTTDLKKLIKIWVVDIPTIFLFLTRFYTADDVHTHGVSLIVGYFIYDKGLKLSSAYPRAGLIQLVFLWCKWCEFWRSYVFFFSFSSSSGDKALEYFNEDPALFNVVSCFDHNSAVLCRFAWLSTKDKKKIVGLLALILFDSLELIKIRGKKCLHRFSWTDSPLFRI